MKHLSRITGHKVQHCEHAAVVYASVVVVVVVVVVVLFEMDDVFVD